MGLARTAAPYFNVVYLSALTGSERWKLRTEGGRDEHAHDAQQTTALVAFARVAGPWPDGDPGGRKSRSPDAAPAGACALQPVSRPLLEARRQGPLAVSAPGVARPPRRMSLRAHRVRQHRR